MKKSDVEIQERSESKTPAQPSRRRLLQALTAGGAAVVAAPAEWTKPALNAVMLPAHAQTSDACTSIGAWVFSSGGGSFSMSITAQADASCGNSASVTLYNGDGLPLGTCSNAAFTFGSSVSWSCSINGSGELDGGEQSTLVVSWSNGCSCTIIRSAL